jgi:hypothetical protein
MVSLNKRKQGSRDALREVKKKERGGKRRNGRQEKSKKGE